MESVVSWGYICTRIGRRARYWGESVNRSSNATPFGVALCLGDMLPPFGITPFEVSMGDRAVMVAIV